MTEFFFGTLLPWLLVGVCFFLIYQLVRQQRRMLLYLEQLQEQQGKLAVQFSEFIAQQRDAAPKPPKGLAVGVLAPEFELPDLAGRTHKLHEFLGRELLLVFFNPGCGYCTQIAPELARLPTDGSNGHALPVIIATGDADATRKLVEEYKLQCPVLYDAKGEWGGRYQAAGTPTGYLIDENGLIASPLAIGAPALLPLVGVEPEESVAGRESNGEANGKGKADRGLGASRIKRDGLKAGAKAPDFRLPLVDGSGEVALDDYRGKRLLLIFSDPQCGPCDALSQQLEVLHQRNPEVAFLLIGRRGAEAMRNKAAQFKFTFPVVIQKEWEVSLRYAMFATPIGYLIDENGIIMYDVAVGTDAIVQLLSDPVPA